MVLYKYQNKSASFFPIVLPGGIAPWNMVYLLADEAPGRAGLPFRRIADGPQVRKLDHCLPEVGLSRAEGWGYCLPRLRLR